MFGEWLKKKEKDADILGALIGRTIGIFLLSHSDLMLPANLGFRGVTHTSTMSHCSLKSIEDGLQ